MYNSNRVISIYNYFLQLFRWTKELLGSLPVYIYNCYTHLPVVLISPAVKTVNHTHVLLLSLINLIYIWVLLMYSWFHYLWKSYKLYIVPFMDLSFLPLRSKSPLHNQNEIQSHIRQTQFTTYHGELNISWWIKVILIINAFHTYCSNDYLYLKQNFCCTLSCVFFARRGLGDC